MDSSNNSRRIKNIKYTSDVEAEALAVNVVTKAFLTKQLAATVAGNVSFNILVKTMKRIGNFTKNDIELLFKAYVNQINNDNSVGWKFPPNSDPFFKKMNFGLFLFNFPSTAKALSYKTASKTYANLLTENNILVYALSIISVDLGRFTLNNNKVTKQAGNSMQSTIRREVMYDEILNELGVDKETFLKNAENTKQFLLFPACIRSKYSVEDIILLGKGINVELSPSMSKTEMCSELLYAVGEINDAKTGYKAGYDAEMLQMLIKYFDNENGLDDYADNNGIFENNRNITLLDVNFQNFVGVKLGEWLRAAGKEESVVATFSDFARNQNTFDKAQLMKGSVEIPNAKMLDKDIITLQA